MSEEVKKKRVSYSQFSNWFDCPHRWYLDNIKKLRIFDESIHTCFGDAIHETIQTYIEALYKNGIAVADEQDLHENFKKAFENYLVEKKIVFTELDRQEFIKDGNQIIDSFSNVSTRIKHFPSNKYEFIGVEDEIVAPIKNNVQFICYIDLILKEKSTGRYRIIDIKTSTYGWNSYTQQNPAKYSQVLLYKAFFSKKYNVPMNKIDVEFFILKRKLLEGVSYPQSRIQCFSPTQNDKTVTGILSTFSQFVSECFNKDGTYIEEQKAYPKIPGKNKKHCKYCPHKKVNCDAKADIVVD